MEHNNKHLLDSLNKVLDLQIDAIQELLENNPIDGSVKQKTQLSVLQRKKMVDQLVSLILRNGGKIDKRINITSTPHNIIGEKEVSQPSSLINTNDQLMALYSAIIKNDGISKSTRTILSKHYERINSDMIHMLK